MILEKIEGVLKSENLKKGFPSYTIKGRWWFKPFDHPDFWDLGFFVGLLIKIEDFRDIGLSLLKRLEEREYPLNHNLGFLVYSSFAPAYIVTGSKRIRDRIEVEAKRLASLFDKSLGFIPMDYPRSSSIAIDTLASIEMLWWASKEFRNEELFEIARKHALSSLRFLLRDDGSTIHIYSMSEGPIKGQGLSSLSCWSRGAAWGALGFLRAYEETGEAVFNEACKRILRFARRNVDEDGVPPWDFCDRYGPKDTSAGAIFLKVLSSFDREFSTWRSCLLKTLSLKYVARERDWEGLLKGGCYHYHWKKGINESLIWGDFFALDIFRSMV
ncbi:MAG: glycoside hydrolase family 88 protein [Synergistetes bacterium]|nr:glycoside hydrolase family 88 protein [Synergistota bacterium]MCX8128367.1 glycoside hydrolase family 88 protein [Synergistota bacterium]MDW8192975.1 hypothetical protein [Synergistota bacterium]